MSYFTIFDSSANLVDSFASEEEARHALEEILRDVPEAADDYAIITYDGTGMPEGEAIVGSEFVARA